MSLTLDLYTIDGKKEGTFELPQTLFAAKVSPLLLAQAVRVYLHNQRRAHAITKDRGDVAFTKAKMYRQKGTGRARHGSKTAPVFVGGGVAHGPDGHENYHLKLTKSMRRLALSGALTAKVSDKQITLVKGLEKLDGKTKGFQKLLTALKLDAKPILLLLDKPNPIILRAVRGLTGVRPTQAKRVNTYEVLRHAHLLATPESVTLLADHFSKE